MFITNVKSPKNEGIKSNGTQYEMIIYLYS